MDKGTLDCIYAAAADDEALDDALRSTARACRARSAGLFRIATQFADLLVKPNNKLLVPAIYPELTRLAAQRRFRERAEMVRRTILFAGGVSAGLLGLLVVAGEPLIALAAGPEFAAAYPTMICLAVAGLIGAWTFPLEPLLVADGRVAETVAARTLAMAAYLGLLYALLPAIGVIGAGVAGIAYAAICAGLFLGFHLGLSRRAVQQA